MCTDCLSVTNKQRPKIKRGKHSSNWQEYWPLRRTCTTYKLKKGYNLISDVKWAFLSLKTLLPHTAPTKPVMSAWDRLRRAGLPFVPFWNPLSMFCFIAKIIRDSDRFKTGWLVVAVFQFYLHHLFWVFSDLWLFYNASLLH